jgi:tripartite-type tricarboxylate transporter receptor subunit TctC
VNMVHVPYKAAAHLGVMANEAQIMFEGLGPLIGPVRGGKLKAIAAAGPKRFGQLPNVPTTAEAGLPGFEITVHMGLVAPKDTPGEVVRGLNAVVMKAMSTREVTDMFISQGLEPTPASPERYAAIIRDDVLRWARASKSVGAKVD